MSSTILPPAPRAKQRKRNVPKPYEVTVSDAAKSAQRIMSESARSAGMKIDRKSSDSIRLCVVYAVYRRLRGLAAVDRVIESLEGMSDSLK